MIMQIGNYKIIKYEYNNLDTREMFEFTDFSQIKCEFNEKTDVIRMYILVECSNSTRDIFRECEHLFSHEEYTQLLNSELKDVITVAEAIIDYDFDELRSIVESGSKVVENPFELRYPVLIGFESFYVDRYIDKDGEHMFGQAGAENGVFKKIEDELEEIYNFDAVEGDTIDTAQHKLYAYLEEIESEE